MQNVFIFNQGASQPKLRLALPGILTAFACDTLLIVLAVMGISVGILKFAWLKLALFVFGFLFLMYMGFVLWKSEEDPSIKQKAAALSFRQQIYFAASVSLLNPHAILDTVGVIGTNSIHYLGEQKVFFAAGCIAVSFVWFLGLAIAGKLIRQRDNSAFWLGAINKISAVIMWAVGSYILWQTIVFIIKG